MSEHRLQVTLNVVIGLLLVAADLAFVWCTKLTIDIATHVRTDVSLSVAVGALVAIVVVQLGLGYATKWVRAILGLNAQNRMRRQLFARLLDADWLLLRSHHSGHLTNRLEQDVSTVTTFLTENVATLLTTLCQFAGAFLLLFYMDRRLACLIVIILPVFLLCSRLYVSRMRAISRQVRDDEGRIQSLMQESLQHVLVVKALEQTEGMANRLSREQHTLHRHVLHRTRYASLSSLVLNVGFATGYMVTFLWGVTSLEQGLITYGALVAFIQLVGQIQGPVRTLSRFIPIFISTFTAAERLVELERIPLETAVGDAAIGKADKAAAVQIRFDDVCYYYTLADGSHGRPILRHFSHTFAPGSITAVMGETGAGKTTLIRLLLALVRPTSGRVTAIGADGSESELQRATRSLFTYVPQGNTLISGTLRDNLLMACPEATEAEMLEALHLADADFVMDKATGLDTPCGEMGGGFSEGQAQRFAIARALLRRRPILLLDEATSALDAATEQRVLRRIVEARPGVTIIVVTHRPEVLRYCTDTIRLERLTAH
ncbi:MAG: ABC transporter ATP-binding protein [Alloprevotella sp.]|nr:ABC transporter ATP-binding protein [Alloprevotella sp.]